MSCHRPGQHRRFASSTKLDTVVLSGVFLLLVSAGQLVAAAIDSCLLGLVDIGFQTGQDFKRSVTIPLKNGEVSNVSSLDTISNSQGRQAFYLQDTIPLLLIIHT